MKDAVHLIMWIFVGALCVLIVKNASGFSSAVSAVGGQINNSAALLSGSGYVQTKSK